MESVCLSSEGKEFHIVGAAKVNKRRPAEHHYEVLLSVKCSLQSQLTVFCLTNTNGTIIAMCRKFHTNNLACLRGCYDQLCQKTAVLIKINVFYQGLKGYNLLFLEVMSLYYGEAGMRIERCREDCYDLSNLLAAG